ncbi:Cmgc/mapk protein kinase, partial [Globisporangium splendens]
MSMQSSDATESVAAVSASGTPVTTTPELSAQGRDLLLGALGSTSSSTAADAEQSAMESADAVNGDVAAAGATESLLLPPSTTASLAAPDTLATSSDRSSSFNNRTSNVENVEDFLFDSTASTPGVAHEVHWEGYVRKKGDWLPRWEERYLVLDGAALTYYNTKEEARSARNLRGRMIISKVRPENYGKAHGFLIETKGHKHFHLCCSTELEKDMWVEMMQAAIDEGVKHSVNGASMDSDVVPVQNSPTQVDLRSFYYAFRQLLISHSSSPQFFPKLSRDVVLTSNYAPTVPFWGEYHGLDGVLHFFSILYETVEFTAFFVTDIAQAREGSTAVVAGRETMKNRDNGRKFTQQWQHTIEFAPDGRVKSLTIHADPVAASAVFGCNATSSLSLPMAAVVGNSNQDNPAGTLHVVVFRGEQISSHGTVTPGDDSDADSSSGETLLPQRRVFLGLRLITDGKTNVYAPSSSSSCLAQTRICEVDEAVDPKWNSQHELSFKGSSRGKPCFMLIEAWEVKEKEHEDDPDVEEIIGVAKVNLAPFLALASTSRTVRESVLHSDIARGAVPQWYTLLSANETKFSCGRVQLSISFEAHNGSSNGALTGPSVSQFGSGSSPGLDSEAPTPQVRPPGIAQSMSQRVALAKGYSFRDTKRDNHQFRVGNTNFDVPKRYQMIKAVGQGAYGCVIAASDMETGQAIAIKNVPNAFNDLIDAKRILREIRLMRHLNHPNLVNLVDLIRPPSLHEFNDVYIVTDLMETDLHRVIHSNQSITDDHVQYFLYQMLVSIHYVHSAQVLHRDLKPSNILVNSDCDLKLCDFGLARGVHGLDSGLTEYVVTRWYRAPELLLSSKYDKQMDVWAIGCILAEMLGRRPLFPGHDYLHQLKIIMDVIGSPSEDSLDFITNPKAKRFILRQPKKPKVPLSSIYPRATPQCLDLLEKMLVFDPRKRLTIAEALEHPYLSMVRDKSLERTCPTPFDFDFENTELTKQKLQELIFEDVCAFHPDARIPETSPNGSISSFGSNSRSASSSNVRAQPSSAPRADVVPPVPSSVPMAEPTSSVYGSHDSQTNGKPPRPAPVVLLPPAALAATATTTATHERSMAETEIVREEVAIDIRDSNAEVHFVSAESNAVEEESFDDIGSTSIHNVVLTETSTGNSSTEREIDLSASPHKLSLPKNMLTPSSVV